MQFEIMVFYLAVEFDTLFLFIRNILNTEHIFFVSILLILVDHFKSVIKLSSLFFWSFKKRIVNRDDDSFSFLPKISILIPAYNADKVQKTIQSVIDTTYTNKEIIVIVNGSDKKTFDDACYFQKQFPDLVTVCFLEEKGKAKALNYGLKIAKGNYIVTLDADSKIIYKDSFEKILKRFESDKDIIAMSGDIQVFPGDNSTKNIWTRLQAIEYLIIMHVGRRFQTIFNTMLVIPGGFAAFNRSYLNKDQPFNEKSITEDFVISIDIHGYGKKVVFEPNAAARFDTPDNLTKLKKQRIRWSSGQAETLMMFKNFLVLPIYNKFLKLGLLDMWSTELIINALWVVTILGVLPFTIINNEFNILPGLFQTPESHLQIIHTVYNNPLKLFDVSYHVGFLFTMIMFYLLLETITFLYAIKLSKRNEYLGLIWYLPLYVFVYRPILRFVVFQGHIKGIRGKVLTWDSEKICQKKSTLEI